MLDQFINLISLYKTQIIIGIIVTLAVSALIFLFRNLFRKLWQLIFPPSEKKMKQDNKLYQHFKDIKQEATEIVDSCINLTDYYGMILIKNLSLTIDWGDYVARFGVGLLPQPSTIFAAHFSKEAVELAKWRTKIEEHNKSRVDLDYKIKGDFESRNIRVLNINKGSNRPFCVYDTIFRPLFEWWQSCNGPNPWPSFNKIETKANGGPNNLYAEGWGSQAIAYARTNSGKKKCKSVIRKIARDTNYKKEVSFLTISAAIILNKTRALAQKLNDRLDDIEKFWPGTRSNNFQKEKKKCPKCKEIFGKLLMVNRAHKRKRNA